MIFVLTTLLVVSSATQCPSGSLLCSDLGTCTVSCPSLGCSGPRYSFDADSSCRPLSDCGVTTPGFVCGLLNSCVSNCSQCAGRTRSRLGWHRECYDASPDGCLAIGLVFCPQLNDCVSHCDQDCPSAPLTFPDSSCGALDPSLCAYYSPAGRAQPTPVANGQKFCALTTSCVPDCSTCSDGISSFLAATDSAEQNVCAHASPAGCAALPPPAGFQGRFVFCPTSRTCVLHVTGTIPCVGCPTEAGSDIMYLSEASGVCVPRSRCSALSQFACPNDALCYPRPAWALAAAGANISTVATTNALRLRGDACVGCGSPHPHPTVDACTSTANAVGTCWAANAAYCPVDGRCKSAVSGASLSSASSVSVLNMTAAVGACGGCHGMHFAVGTRSILTPGGSSTLVGVSCAAAGVTQCDSLGMVYCNASNRCVSSCAQCAGATVRRPVVSSSGASRSITITPAETVTPAPSVTPWAVDGFECVAASTCRTFGERHCATGGLDDEGGVCMRGCAACPGRTADDALMGTCAEASGAGCLAATGRPFCAAQAQDDVPSCIVSSTGGAAALTPSTVTACGGCSGRPWWNVTSNECAADCARGVGCAVDATCRSSPSTASPAVSPSPAAFTYLTLASSAASICAACGVFTSSSNYTAPAMCIRMDAMSCAASSPASYYCGSVRSCVTACSQCLDPSTGAASATDFVHNRCVPASPFGCSVLGGGQAYCPPRSVCVPRSSGGCSTCFDAASGGMRTVLDAAHSVCVTDSSFDLGTSTGSSSSSSLFTLTSGCASVGGNQTYCASSGICLGTGPHACAACPGAPIVDTMIGRCVADKEGSCSGGRYICRPSGVCVGRRDMSTFLVPPSPGVPKFAPFVYIPLPPPSVPTSDAADAAASDCAECVGSNIADVASRVCMAPSRRACAALTTRNIFCPSPPSCVSQCSKCASSTYTTLDALNGICIKGSGAACAARGGQTFCAPTMTCLPPGDCSRCPQRAAVGAGGACVNATGAVCAADELVLCRTPRSIRCVQSARNVVLGSPQHVLVAAPVLPPPPANVSRTRTPQPVELSDVSGVVSLDLSRPFSAHGCSTCDGLRILDAVSSSCVASRSTCSPSTAYCPSLTTCLGVPRYLQLPPPPSPPPTRTPPRTATSIPTVVPQVPVPTATPIPPPSPSSLPETSPTVSPCTGCPRAPAYAPSVGLCVAASGAACRAADASTAFCPATMLCISSLSCNASCTDYPFFDATNGRCAGAEKGCFAPVVLSQLDCSTCTMRPYFDIDARRCVNADACGATGSFVCEATKMCVDDCSICSGAQLTGGGRFCVSGGAPSARYGGVYSTALFVAAIVLAVIIIIVLVLCFALLFTRSGRFKAPRRRPQKRVDVESEDDIPPPPDAVEHQESLRAALETHRQLRKEWADVS